MARTNRARTAVAAAIGAVPVFLPVIGAPAAASAADPPSPDPAPTSFPTADNPYCATRALPKAELDAGRTSTVQCFSVEDDALRSIGVDPGSPELNRARRKIGAKQTAAVRDGLLATHYSEIGSGGSYLNVGGTACDGGGIAFPAGDPWNDLISSTKHRGCGNVKHFETNAYGGSTEITSGGYCQVVNLSTLNNATSAVRYYEPYL